MPVRSFCWVFHLLWGLNNSYWLLARSCLVVSPFSYTTGVEALPVFRASLRCSFSSLRAARLNSIQVSCTATPIFAAISKVTSVAVCLAPAGSFLNTCTILPVICLVRKRGLELAVRSRPPCRYSNDGRDSVERASLLSMLVLLNDADCG